MEISKANGQLDAAFANLGQRASGAHQTYSDIQAGENQSQGGDEKQQGNLNNKLTDIVRKLNEQMDSLDTNVRFGYSDKIDSMYISVTEKSTGREIRQIPSEEAMRLAEYFRDVIGMIFDKES
ncbi:FlaG family protein [Campylobacter coli]|uniref:FlaG family protein n=1 Tax=Campylobacter coli TaxID=195 RepID=UPI00073EA805|nr:FlaG family protein [Campylobacter coli]EAK8023326.1 flagellar biosynthesis protein FlaG [Campylobacter coli]HEB7546170.1 flagellar protein FlaG [Campylobacter coli]HED6587185.1 flagellar protein FlaG [Campylobacter coli]HED6593897.1 flagellar protein FlaG [Campylobacter coli]HED6602611.1 flagellar protein FlaG [Campylobacter coli]